MKATRLSAVGLLAPAFMLLATHPAGACSVCLGNPDSPMVHGAQQGVLTMLLITYSMMAAMLAMFGFIVVHARRSQGRRTRP